MGLRRRAEAGAFTADELAGGALTVSNLGGHGLDRFTAVINPPQAAALAVGAARPRPAVHQGELAIRTLLDATLSLDHRVAAGVTAARFLQELRHLLEQPGLLPLDDPSEAGA
jgi:pyruvate dehydrogenase E2 component (dihydrolipoamide acetyltransferase)